MPSMTDFTYTDNMDENKQPFLDDFRAALQSVEDQLNLVMDNVDQVATDLGGAGYAYTGDGSPALANSDVYNKQVEKATDTTGDHAISTTGSWQDVDATNAKVSITPDLAGHFRAEAQFNVEAVTTNATNEVKVRFRLFDGTDGSDAVAKIHRVTGVTGTTNTSPVSLSHVFEDWTAALKTVKLQYWIDTLTNTTLKVLANNNHPIAMAIEKV